MNTNKKIGSLILSAGLLCGSISANAASPADTPLETAFSNQNVPAPVRHLISSDKVERDSRVRTYVTPIRIVWHSENNHV